MLTAWTLGLAIALGPSWKTDSATVILHRAAGMVAPENTWPSLGEAVRQGADGVEIDVRRLDDGSLVLYHDDWLPATPFGPGRSLESLPAEIARSIRPGERWGSRFDSLGMPEFGDVLQFAKAHDLKLFLDVKTSGITEPLMQAVDRAQARSLVVVVGGKSRVEGLPPLRWVRGWNYTDGGEENPERMAQVVADAEPGLAFMVDDARTIAMALKRDPKRRPLRDLPVSATIPSPRVPSLPNEVRSKDGWLLTLRPTEWSTAKLIDTAKSHAELQVRLDAIMALGNGGHESAISELTSLFDREDPSDPANDPIGYAYFNTYLRASIACALAAMHGAESRAALRKLAASKRSFAAEAVVVGMSARGREEDLPTIAALIRQIPSAASFALSFVGRFDAKAWPVYLAALDAGSQNRRQAVFMLAGLEEQVLDAVVDEIKRTHDPSRRLALVHTLYWMESSRAREARAQLLETVSENERKALMAPRPWSKQP